MDKYLRLFFFVVFVLIFSGCPLPDNSAHETYIINYNANNATSGTTPSGQTKTAGINLTLASNTGGLARTGFSFAGWNTQADGNGTDYAEGAVYAIDADLELFAKWTNLPTYTVTYNANNATSGTPPSSQTKIEGINLTLASNTGGLARTGYTFEGWNTQADGNGTAYAEGAVYTIDADLELFAKWIKLPTYTVTYNANNATSGTPPSSQIKTAGINLTLASNTGSLARTGYTFAGWNTQADGNGTAYAEGATYTIDADLELFAKWTNLPTYTVTYNANNATSGTPPSSQTKTAGINLTLASNTGGLARTGYTFEGWNTLANGTGTNYTEGATYTIDADLELFAKWKILPTYTVTYNANNATSGTPPSSQTKTAGINLTLASNTGGLARTGYTFEGWNTLANGTGTNYAEGATYTIDADLVLYAKWAALKYTVTYDANNATNGTAPTDGLEYKEGDTVTVAGAGTLIRTNYTFMRWNTKSDGSGTGYIRGTTFHMGNADVTLYAEWSDIGAPGRQNLGVIEKISAVDNRYFYAIDKTNATLHKYDSQTSSVASIFPLQYADPVDMEYGTAGGILYIAYKNQETISRFDINSGLFLSSLVFDSTASHFPTAAVEMDEADNRIYIMLKTNYFYDYNLTVIDLLGNEITAPTGAMKGPLMEFEPISNILYTANTGISAATIERYTFNSDVPVLKQTENDLGSNGGHIEVSADGNHLAFFTGSGNDTNEIYDLSPADLTDTNGAWQSVKSLYGLFSPDSTLMYVLGGCLNDEMIRIYRTGNHTLVREFALPNNDEYVRGALSPDGTKLLAFTYNGYSNNQHAFYLLTDILDEPQDLTKLGRVKKICAANNQYFYAIDATNATLHKINAQSGLVETTFLLEHSYPVDMEFGTSGGILYIAYKFQEKISRFDTSTDAFLSSISFDSTKDHFPTDAIEIDEADNRMYILMDCDWPDDSIISITDLSGHEILAPSIKMKGPLMEFEPVSNTLYVANTGVSAATIELYTLSADVPVFQQSSNAGGGYGYHIEVSADGNHLMFHSTGGNVVRDLSPSDVTVVNGTWDTGRNPIYGLFSPDSKLMYDLGGSPYDETIKIFRSGDHTFIRELNLPNNDEYVRGALSPDGTRLLAFTYDTYYNNQYAFYIFTDILDN